MRGTLRLNPARSTTNAIVASRVAVLPVLLLASLLTPLRTSSVVAEESANEESGSAPQLTNDWLVLWDARKQPRGRRPLPKSSPLKVLTDLEIDGVPEADPFWLDDFEAKGNWGSIQRRLQRSSGKDSAVRLARGEDFELQGVINAEGLGGWFLLVGMEKGHGYVLYNVTLKSSGSPWITGELRDSTIIESTHREVHRYLWKGDEPVVLTVEKKKLTLRVGSEVVVEELELPNYHAGDIILGTYDTPYGPKPVSLRSLRIRAR